LLAPEPAGSDDQDYAEQFGSLDQSGEQVDDSPYRV